MVGEAKKRPFGSTIRTLNDISNGVGSWNDAENDASTSNSKIVVQHIPNLPNDIEAAAILRRIHFEFKEIIERRKWNVRSITEMCCCGDGKDHSPHKRGCRKTKIMPNNVLGYNLTASSYTKTHEIHLRLRHPRTHALLDYESIAGTMCHELAHCVRGPHDAHFYKAMNEIEEQYEIYLAKGVVVDKDGFPLGSNDAHVLGGRRVVSSSKTAAAAAAESRRKKNANGLTHGYVLGGKKRAIPKDPREAARIAAERRLLDSKFCLPCSEVIEILADSSDEEIDDDDSDVQLVEPDAPAAKQISKSKTRHKNGHSALDTKPKAVDYPTTTTTSSDDSVIDLTEDSFEMTNSSSFDEYSYLTSATSAADQKKPSTSLPKAMSIHHSEKGWTCPRCTLHNTSIVLVCEACNLERQPSK
mmetsp:Transcript_9706/g.16050  ORF Transcript_9706/g.16050 Transcript_9706/m.16050 type:complete len:414 (-) Transcript_9706:85-1326(-)